LPKDSPTLAIAAQTPFELRTRPADGAGMVYVPGGTFQMGSSDAQIDAALALCEQYPDDYGKCKLAQFETEAPQHTVTLGDYWIDRTEVTNAQYARCVAAGACHESRLEGDPAYNGDDYPVAGIPWQSAMDYCAWAGGRLPTEAEWEYAARGTEGGLYPWGHEFDCSGGNFWDDVTGCDDEYPKPAPVGSYPDGASWCGALDMAGNVWEWVADAYGPYPAEPQTNPTGPASGSERILRGGSWGYHPPFVRTAYRYPVPPSADYLAVGFRCAGPATIPGLAPSGEAAPSPSPGDTRERPADDMEMLYVPAAEFEMGSDDVEVELALEQCRAYGTNCSSRYFAIEKPVHTVVLDAFWMDKTEVTQGQYAQCVGAGECSEPECQQEGQEATADLPVVCVTWDQAAAYCAWVGGRLPTEAEWEYAARGPERRRYPWGDEFDGTRLNYCDANCELVKRDEAFDDGYAQSAPVGSYPDGASWIGALDMAGNVWELVADWYGNYAPDRQVNPSGPPSGGRRVARGGSWHASPDHVRSALRTHIGAPEAVDHAGFRCVLTDP
jgi:formylglycine-generating enzyme required for sulfatase activity